MNYSTFIAAAGLTLAISLPTRAEDSATDGPPGPPPGATWQLAGRLGIATYIVVPVGSARDKAFYDGVIDSLCPKDATCFLRFFTNTEGAAVGLPLPDAIEKEPTVMFQQSAKYGGRHQFLWSCRLKVPDDDCF